ncbi:hypothetical protein MB46_17705 [Arthrobacter alpinus]|uniref:cupin domain-containing protein n=1 Tax=Arthrobacter alpinus TaxID=656366 RepID=UPI0005C93B40|nr:cupin domain-containing protein [Arthrobacter alpinus]ALV47047.1 hypothetical protein MB46_17705 [Arthrobacter alpinus]
MGEERETTEEKTPFFPGGTALTRLAVYDWEAADGLCGGAPHMHTASTEAYLVVGGQGRVETLRSGACDVHDLAVGDLLWFSPGTIHRLINDGNLDLLVVMQNSGLPEAGDAVLTFLPEILADPEDYRRTAQLPVGAGGGAREEPLERERAALARRDAAMIGYQRLKDAALAGDWRPVQEFHAQAVRLIQAHVPQWRELWEGRVAAEAADTDAYLTELAAGRYAHFARAAVGRASPTSEVFGLGMCGFLQTWAPGRYQP